LCRLKGAVPFHVEGNLCADREDTRDGWQARYDGRIRKPQPLRQRVGKVVVVEDIQATDDKRGGNAAICLKILKDAGVGDPSRLYTQSTCDSLFFLKAALDRANALTPAGLRAAVESLGTTYDSAFTWATRYGPGRHDGADAVRPSKFEDKCGCYRLTGPPRSIA